MAMPRIIFLVVLLFCMLCCFINNNIEAAPQGSLIKYLPGFNGSFPSKHYAGYVTIDDGDNHPSKNLYYYFVVSERNQSTDPVVLWLNGGPGCSSFDGFVYEHGPFNFDAAKQEGGLPTLHLNPYSWSKVSSIIYLDSPAGVGFSYSDNTSLYKTGDIQTAYDTHLFLLKWFEQFPEFTGNEFYIAGESYAGVYVPTLASVVDKGIRTGVKPVIKFKGYMVGNGVCDPRFDSDDALVPFAHGMGLISDHMYKATEVACKRNYHNYTNSDECDSTLSKIYSALDGLNQYDILEHCYHSRAGVQGNKSNELPESFKQLGMSSDKPLPVRKRMFGRAWPFRAPVKGGLIPLWPQLMESGGVQCIDDTVATVWLNNKEVRKAIHANPSGEWGLCTDNLSYNNDAGSMLSYHKNLTASGYRILIYSGDHDMCIPFTGTQAWTESLGYQIIDEWRSWISNDQIAGYIQGYANDFTFLTIKGAGHTVPEYKPRESLDFYSRWLKGQKI
ncbi:serine carboxypeptidase-like 20 [Olea europaea subsp. europaea]|uniref:Carboxypeptidase n=1 Tax=Olea europaea subsp. europaea TaxID=158383 RepID=A0A8S0U2B5_OLEEU|nr:serine carboxypeptidase-like 20 [Olea europaea subsp. europaea]